jgi:protocatechuate 3,4-dioxygenase beta subunit
MDHDDTPIGRVLTRREALAILGASGVALFAGNTLGPARRVGAHLVVPSCVARPEQTEGPYFVDEHLNRPDIRSDPSDGVLKPGVPLALALAIARIRGRECTPLAGAQVDIWHCDADGIYSDVTDPHFRTVGHKFLRGYQLTDATGTARFTTIYPGWYPGRTVHIHFKVRTAPSSPQGHAFTSQLYFDDDLTDRVHALAPYAARGQRTMRNGGDRIFPDGGPQLMLAPTARRDGYAASFALGLQMDS